MLLDFFKTLLKPDRDDTSPSEKGEVLQAANILQVGEFQLLQLAYAEWHHHDLPEQEIGKLFTRYMLKDEVPAWARHFARRVLEAYAAREINTNHPYFHRFDNAYFGKPASKEARRMAQIAMIVVAFVVVGLLAVQMPEGTQSRSLFPPFHVEGEFDAERLDGEN